MLQRFKDFFPPRRLRRADEGKAHQAELPTTVQAEPGAAEMSDGSGAAGAGAAGAGSGTGAAEAGAAEAGSGTGAVEAGGDSGAAGAANVSGADGGKRLDCDHTAASPPAAKPQTPAQRTGRAGEEAAARFLTMKDHRILERNWRAGRDEIDLITRDGPALVFVEVRTRAGGALVGGFHSIDARKKAALRRVCGAYLKTCRPRPQTYRLDVVQISMGKGGQMEIHHYAGVALFN